MERREDCYCLNVFPQNSYIEILTWKIMLLGGKAFGRFLSHEVEPSWIRLVPYRRGSREISTSFYCVRLQWKVFQLRVFTQPCLGHNLELPVSRTLENVFIAYKLPNLWYFFFFFLIKGRWCVEFQTGWTWGVSGTPMERISTIIWS